MKQEFWADPWVIGIAGSIVGGLFVALVVSFVNGRRKKIGKSREYVLLIGRANSEILGSVRHQLAEARKPLSLAYVDDMIRATARQYEVRVDDLFSIDEIVEATTKYVLELPLVKPHFKTRLLGYLEDLKRADAERRRFKVDAR